MIEAQSIAVKSSALTCKNREGGEMSVSEALSRSELDLEMAEVLAPRETLAAIPINITVDPNIVVTPVIGLAIAVQAATIGSNNAAVLIQSLHLP
jgi:hypothetical protein